MISTKQNGYQPKPCGIENPVPPKTGSNVDFALYHKKQLIRFCKKFHKDCYRLVGQKMALKDKVADLGEQIEKVKYTLNKIIETVHNDRIDEYGARLVLIKDFAYECLEEIEND